MFLGLVYKYIISAVIAFLLAGYNIYCFIGLFKLGRKAKDTKPKELKHTKSKFNIYAWVLKKTIKSNNKLVFKAKLGWAKKIDIGAIALSLGALLINIALIVAIYMLNIQATNISNVITTIFGDKDCNCYAKCTGNPEDDSKTTYELLFGAAEYEKLCSSLDLHPSVTQELKDMHNLTPNGKLEGEWLIQHLDENAVQCYKDIVGNNNKFRSGDHKDRSKMTNAELREDLIALLSDYKIDGRNPNCTRCTNTTDLQLATKCLGEAHWVPGWTWEAIWDSDNSGDGSDIGDIGGGTGGGGGSLPTNAEVEAALRANGYSGKAAILAAAYQMCLDKGWGKEFAIGLMANIQHEGQPGKVEGISYASAFEKKKIAASKKRVLSCGCSKNGTVTIDYWAASGVSCSAHELAGTILSNTSSVDVLLSIPSGVEGIGVGSIQWSGSRRPGILQRYKNCDFSEQGLAQCDLEYMVDELSNGYADVVNVCSGKSAEDCAQLIHDNYEKSGDSNAVTARRATASKLKEIIDNIQTSGGSSGGGASSNISASTQEILNMDDATFWKFISDDRFSSYEEASAAWRKNESSEKAFWNSMITTIQVPCWKWGSSYDEKVAQTRSIQVNKKLVPFFTDFMTDLYNLPEKYVIVSVGGFSPRLKNNGSSNPGLSSHTFGSTLDINESVRGMGSVPVYGPERGVPFKSSSGLSEPDKSQCCTLDNSWFALAKKYQLNWGGLWSYSSQDPMHFSIVGDGAKKGQVNYEPRGKYR